MTMLLKFVCVALCCSSMMAGLTEVKEIEKLYCGSTTNQCASEEVSTGPQGEPGSMSLLPPPPIYPQPDCCSSCSCDTSDCDIYDNCCLSALDNLPTIDESISTVRMSCVLPQLKSVQDRGLESASYNVRMFTVCIEATNSSQDIIDKCENAAHYTDIFSHIPVGDVLSGLTYTNKYCALCHGIPEDRHEYWTVEITCNELFQANDISTIVEDIQATETCNLQYSVPSDSISKRSTCSTLLISTCNETGLWQVYDKEVETACLAYTSPYKINYKNVFCFICNIDDVFKANEMCVRLPEPFYTPSFSAYLVLPSSEPAVEHITTKCAENEIYDPITVSKTSNITA